MTMQSNNTQINTNDDLAEQILAKITQDNITPTTKAYFVMRDAMLWAPGISITIIGAFAWAGMIFNSTHSSFEYREFVAPGTMSFMAQELPIIWLILFLFFSLFVLKAFRQTKNGYRYSAFSVLSTSLILSCILGYGVYKSDALYHNPLLRFPTERIQKKMWFNPAEGRIIGIVNQSPDGTFILTDSHNTSWVLDVHEAPFVSQFMMVDSPVRIIGRVQPDTTFLVCMVLPMQIEKSKKQEIKKIQSHTISPFTQCDIILKEVREFRSERKSKVHP